MQQLVILLVSIVPQYVSGVFTPIIRRSDCVSLPMVFCLVVVVCTVWNRLLDKHPTPHSTIRLSNITTATTGQKTIGSETQSDLLMMDVNTPETC
jgi:hypothetical protein